MVPTIQSSMPLSSQGRETRVRLRLAIVMLNYRTPRLTVDCLESLDGQVRSGKDLVVIVDNGSGDGSVERIERAIADHSWSEWVRLIGSEVNVGFPSGCNIGIRAVDADAYLLLNNDTIVLPGAIESLLGALEAHPEAGIISPRLQWPDGRRQVNCRRYITPISEFMAAASTGPVSKLLKRYDILMPISDGPEEPQWLCFASAVIRREVFEKIGLLDEGYFNYFDDVDFCRRTWGAGWRVLSWPEAEVIHLIGSSQSVESSRAEGKRRPAYYYASRARYLAKFYGTGGLWAANLLWTAGRLIALMREVVRNKKPHVCEKEWRDIWINWRDPMKPPVREEVKPLEHLAQTIQG